MRHSIHIMLGKASEGALLKFNSYVIRFASEEMRTFFHSALITVDGEKEKNVAATAVGFDKHTDDLGLHTELVPAYTDTTKIDKKDANESYHAYFDAVKREAITIQNKGDYTQLHICLYVPLYDAELVQVACEAIKSMIGDTGQNFHVDVIGLMEDLQGVFPTAEHLKNLKAKDLHAQVIKSINTLSKLHTDNANTFRHFIVMQDCQNGGIALNLTEESLVRIIGEFAMLCISNYSDLFGNMPSKSEVQGIGLSMLSLDKVYFTEYLMRKVYLSIMVNEKISENQIDINKVSQRAHDLLTLWVHLFSTFFDKEVKQRMDADKSLEKKDIIAQINPILDEQFAKMKEMLQSYVTDPMISIPEKKAILSALLGQDDLLFVNELHDAETYLNIRDIEAEAIEVFLKANNLVIEKGEATDSAFLSIDGQTVEFPVQQLKVARHKARECQQNIRDVQQQQEKLARQLNLQEEAKKCLIEEGQYTFREHKYKLLPKIEEEPLQHKYEPHNVSVASADLSSGFMPICDQGRQGACLAFSMVSVLEFLFRKTGQDDKKLSEQFLYYIARARKNNQNEDNGSYMTEAVTALAETGICEEPFWTYDPEKYAEQPSAEAYENARERKLKTALAVELSVDAIKSALVDGFPVAFSANLYDSFTSSATGFVPVPSKEEIAAANENENRGHAMVICGFDDKHSVFKVRNSWGVQFGDRGYCYMPYSYITNPKLTNWAVILTEAEVAQQVTTQEVVPGTKPIFVPMQQEYPQLRFDETDAQVQYGINQMLLTELESKKNEYVREAEALNIECRRILQKICNDTGARHSLKVDTEVVLQTDIDNTEKQYSKVSNDKSDELDALDKRTLRHYLIAGGIALLFVLLFGLLFHTIHSDKKSVKTWTEYKSKFEKAQAQDSTLRNLSVVEWRKLKYSTDTEKDIKKCAAIDKEYRHYHRACDWVQVKADGKMYHGLQVLGKWWIILIAFMIPAIMALIVFLQHKRMKREIEEEYDDRLRQLHRQIGSLKKDKSELSLKFYVAASILNHIFDVHDSLECKSKVLESFIENLNTWYGQELQRVEEMSVDMQPPFIPILNNDVLNQFYKKHMTELIGNTHLWTMIEGYEVDEASIRRFKALLDESVNQRLLDYLSTFSMYKYLACNGVYAYVNSEEQNKKKMLNELDARSNIFLMCNNIANIRPSQTFFINKNSEETQAWNDIINRVFLQKPMISELNSLFKVVMFNFVEISKEQIEL